MSVLASDRITVYKFLPANYAIQAIEKRRFKVSTLESLNDPYDTNPYYNTQGREQAFVDDFKDKYMRNYGFISYSQSLKDPVVWAHYADSHKGIAIGVTYHNAELLKIDYQPDKSDAELRPEIIVASWTPKNHEEEMKKILTRKYKSWEYEKEYRSWELLEKCKTEGGLYFKQFNIQNFVSEIVIGLRCNVSCDYLQHALGDDKYGVKFFEAKESRTRYEMEIVQLP